MLVRGVGRSISALHGGRVLASACAVRVGVQQSAASQNQPFLLSSRLACSKSNKCEDCPHQGAKAAKGIVYPRSEARIGKEAPDFTAPAVVGTSIENITLSQLRGQYTVLLFYPKDFTYVCPTEIIAFNDHVEDFAKLNAKVLAISTDTEESHLAWTKVSREQGGLGPMKIPLVADTTKLISAKYGVLLEDAGIALRGLFVIDGSGILQQITINNLPVGRSVEEALRLISAFQFVEKHGEVCPANWSPGDKTMKADPEGSLDYFESVWQPGTDKSPKTHNLLVPKNEEELKSIISSNDRVVLFCSATWCGKCAMIAPFVDSLAQEMNESVAFVKVETTDPALKAFSEGLKLSHLPGFVMFKGGKKLEEVVMGYKKNTLRSAIKANLLGSSYFGG